MKWMLVPLAALFLNLAPRLQAQVTLSAAVNAASYANASLPNGKLAQGVVFIAFGKGMGPAKLAEINAFPLPTVLSGASISATVAGTTVQCIMLYTTATQVAAVLPSNTPVGSGSMVASYNGVNSAPLNITVVAHDFGIFAVNQSGSGEGVFTDAVTNAVNSATAAATSNELVDIWGTGLGPVAGNEAAGPLPGDLPSLDVQVFVGGQQAQVVYRGRSGCCTGLDQIRISIPAGVSGCSVPIYILVGGVVSNFLSMSIATTGSTCVDPNAYPPDLLQTAQKNGGLRAGSASLGRIHVYAKTIDYVSDTAGVGFFKIPLADLNVSYTSPVANACTVVQFPGGAFTGAAPTPLEAGSVSLSGPIGTYPLLEVQPGTYDIAFSPSSGAAAPGLINDGTVLTPGSYLFTGAGGKDIGAFSVTVPLPTAFNWTNRPTVPATIDRSKPLAITWTNGYAGALVYIHGQSQVSPGVGAQFTCWADASAGSFSVPSAVLAAVPPTYLSSGNAQGSLDVYQVFLGPNFNAPSIDIGSTQFTDGFDIGPILYQ
jgi:uncharacterized protein (TIGR03437 family)